MLSLPRPWLEKRAIVDSYLSEAKLNKASGDALQRWLQEFMIEQPYHTICAVKGSSQSSNSDGTVPCAE